MSHKQQVAIKVVSKAKIRESHIPIEKEVLLHKSLQHRNIVKLLEVLEDAEFYYLVQELCAGGELFAFIEPDKGFPLQVVHFYMVQLLNAVLYLHQRGIAHRDIKPENLLLDERGNLKLADFGFSTLYRKGNIRRKLRTVCGSILYMAPEVVEGEYEGDAADLWSCGIVMFVMLIGRHPWEEPSKKCSQFTYFFKKGLRDDFGVHIPAKCREFLLGLLAVDQRKRWKPEQLISHSWFKQCNHILHPDGQCKSPTALMNLISNPACEEDSACPVSSAALSQPHPRSICSQSPGCTIDRNFPGFSQPEGLSTVSSKVVTLKSDVFAEKATRIVVELSANDALLKMSNILDTFLIDWKPSPIRNRIHFGTVDKRKTPLSGDIFVISVSTITSMVIVSKSRGDPLEFKRFFRLIHAKFIE